MSTDARLHRAHVQALRYANSMRDALEFGYIADEAKRVRLLEVAKKCADSIDRAMRIADAGRA